MSANIQFMEPVNLLSPDKGDMSGFWPRRYTTVFRAALYLGLL